MKFNRQSHPNLHQNNSSLDIFIENISHLFFFFQSNFISKSNRKPFSSSFSFHSKTRSTLLLSSGTYSSIHVFPFQLLSHHLTTLFLFSALSFKNFKRHHHHRRRHHHHHHHHDHYHHHSPITTKNFDKLSIRRRAIHKSILMI